MNTNNLFISSAFFRFYTTGADKIYSDKIYFFKHCLRITDNKRLLRINIKTGIQEPFKADMKVLNDIRKSLKLKPKEDLILNFKEIDLEKKVATVKIQNDFIFNLTIERASEAPFIDIEESDITKEPLNIGGNILDATRINGKKIIKNENEALTLSVNNTKICKSPFLTSNSENFKISFNFDLIKSGLQSINSKMFIKDHKQIAKITQDDTELTFVLINEG